ncbi:D-alanyl-D-alanine carboxypeptidase [Anaerocolumna cellulosilytica]|uniref:D-alanyl-D-alanine carboxypeptidase n=1 Tax=Anaerocolumna cellulosilytica TaxID=433286 RepID=A0A6S6QUR7_9FIRM|nr:M15 family metallopeptidase [Anaerocolumna cellulosilytica]MBB5193770.1 D-alanyl-D-alanine dipeptidase/carboxypeptidase [Anaerocolumna cellulosilytica]BCJ95013.1 D-alanyl-D-alanine carboxypeptidase [Anaerocolumna cellulosilytica]
MKKLLLKPENVHKGNLILVNKEYPIQEKQGSYDSTLVNLGIRDSEVMMDYVAAKELNRIFTSLACGNDIVPVSGYRSSQEQKQIYTDSLQENGRQFTEKYVAYPGHSEHQTGLAIDLAENSYNIDFIRPNFPKKGICLKFRNLAANYGFIERYPKNKTSITGIAHEPWHFRYVGYPHSALMVSLNQTLEEYMVFTKRYIYTEEPYIYEDGQRQYEIYFVPMVKDEITLDLPKDLPYQVSGNNFDGFILTLKTAG